MIYLKDTEVATYCTFAIDPIVLTQANQFVTTYLGDISKQQETDETVIIGRNNKGKLKKIKEHIPLISVDTVKIQTRTPFGITIDPINITDIDVNNFGYLTYYGGHGFNPLTYGVKPDKLLVTYTYGYEVIPDDLKVATGIIAQNITKRGTFGAKQITDFDVQLGFLDDSILTSDVRVILNKYRGI